MPDEPYVLFSVRRSKLGKSDNPEHCWRVLQDDNDASEDLSVWFIPSYPFISRALSWAGDAVMESRVYWGCACWDRVQLLGEIARGGWGVATGHVDVWNQSASECWQSAVPRAVYAGTNDFSKFQGED